MVFVFYFSGDVYMLGCTNVGKSSLFNALIQSDYCKTQAVDLIQRATTSPWPGTTLRLLKFPILNPIGWRLWLRYKRLAAERLDLKEDKEFQKDMYWETRKLKYLSLQGTFTRDECFLALYHISIFFCRSCRQNISTQTRRGRRFYRQRSGT